MLTSNEALAVPALFLTSIRYDPASSAMTPRAMTVEPYSEVSMLILWDGTIGVPFRLQEALGDGTPL